MLDVNINGQSGRSSGRGRDDYYGDATNANEPYRARKRAEQKLVEQIGTVLDRRSTDTSFIAAGLEKLDPHSQQLLMDIILDLLNLWKINNDPALYRHFPNHPLRRVYETANRMLLALGKETAPPGVPMEDTQPIPVVRERISGMVDRLPRNSRRRS